MKSPENLNGTHIKIKRFELGYKQQEIADLIGFSRETISKAENNRLECHQRIWFAINRLPPKGE